MKVGLFGSVHGDGMKSFGKDDNFVLELFDRFQPNIICGEVRKDDYEQNREYQGPSEYKRFIFQYCKERGIKFVPCDEYDDCDAKYNGREVEVSEEDAKEFQRILDMYMKVGLASAIPFNSDEFNALVEQKQALQEKFDPEAQNIVWIKRNNAIVNNILQVIRDNPNANILVVFGAEHIYWLKNALAKLENVEIVFPLD